MDDGVQLALSVAPQIRPFQHVLERNHWYSHWSCVDQELCGHVLEHVREAVASTPPHLSQDDRTRLMRHGNGEQFAVGSTSFTMEITVASGRITSKWRTRTCRGRG